MKIISKIEITTLDEWREHASPVAKDRHWQDGRSAKETAIAWLNREIPEDLKRCLDSREATRDLQVAKVFPELKIRFDSFSGPRNADIAFVGVQETKKVAVTIESKADEPFDVPVSRYVSRAEAALKKNERSKQVARIHSLTKSLFDIENPKDSAIAPLGYQLLSATAGTLAYAVANQSEQAVLLIHVFKTDKTRPEKIEKNRENFRAFLEVIAKQNVAENFSGELFGPFQLPGGDHYENPPPLYIGYVETELDC